MSGGDSQSTETDKVTRLADDLDLVGWEVGNLAVILFRISIANIYNEEGFGSGIYLLLLSIAIQDHTCDLGLYGRSKRLDGAMVDRGSLTVPSGHNHRVWALRRHGVQYVDHGLLARGVSAAREHVGGQGGGVVDAFGCYVEVLLEGIGGLGSDNGSLWFC